MDSSPERPLYSDAEKGSASDTSLDSSLVQLNRQLKRRHITMISIGGVIGTGLFLGTGEALANGGPLGLLLGYVVVGTICYSVMISLGEMITYLPIPGGHIKLAERFVDPALSFTLGWNYWYNWIVLLPAELNAAAILINYWTGSVNNAVWITIGIVIVVLINMSGAAVYGETEFVFASIKVVTIIGLIILGIVLDLGGGPNHDRIGFRYWKHPGPFTQLNGIPGAKGRFLSWFSVLTQATFSYVGTEIVAIAAGEAKNPVKTIPKAIKRVYVRILLFYIGGTSIIGLLVPSNHSGLQLQGSTLTVQAAQSPFVIAIRDAGIKSLPSVVNAALISSAWSAASSDLYTSSRALYGLASSGNAPKIFQRTVWNGLPNTYVPYVSIVTCSLFALLAYMGVHSGSGQVFDWFVNMTAIAGLMTWFGICVTYIRFRKGYEAQKRPLEELVYRHPLNPYAAYYAVVACPTICFFSGWTVFLKDRWKTSTFITNYLPLALFPIIYIAVRLYLNRGPVEYDKMDFDTDRKEIKAATEEEPKPRNLAERIWQWLF